MKTQDDQKVFCDYNIAIDNAIEAIIFHFPKEAVIIDPLAMLAGRFGYSMRIGTNEKGVWFISLRKGRNTRKQITATTYPAAEAEARQYLESLPDKEKT